MMAYLQEAEDMMAGNDLKAIRQMIDVSRQSLSTHTVGFDRVKEQVEQMNREVGEAMQTFSNGEANLQKVVESNRRANEVLAGRIAVIEEDQNGEARFDTVDVEGFRAGGRMSETPLEAQKSEIVKDLLRMNGNMMEFTNDIEERLQKAYRVTGVAKKFGYSSETRPPSERGADKDVAMLKIAE